MEADEKRPSPDALLRTSGAQGGRLKIFLGAAPGVGKTWEMLSAAQARRREGADVVIGLVETHGRAETMALTAGLETIPRRRVAYQNRVLEEMDLDALISRRPGLALVDELAHTNAPGSRHAKRYLDVEELLEAGIDVWTTLNIQHVESLNDVVAQITRIRVRETVPDRIIDRADAIELIDLTPDDLLARLRDGKVYTPRNAERALAHYFSPGNLTALRELALRRTAQRVDAQLLDHMQAHAISGPWSAGERLLVCVTPEAAGPALVRYAARLAQQLRAPWTALHVQTAQDSEAAMGRIAECLREAERLGGQAVSLPGQDAAAEILAYARANNFVHVVIGNAPRRWLRRGVAEALLRRAGGLSVHIVDAEPAPAGPLIGPADIPTRPLPYLGVVGLVGLATLLALAARHLLAANSISLIYLIAVLAAASAWGLLPSLLASILGVAAYNFFFLPPLYTFTIADPENIVGLVCFAATAVIASNLAAGMRAQAVLARQRARTTEELYGFSRKLAAIAGIDDLLWAAAYQVAAMLKLRVVLLLPAGETIALRAAYPPDDELDAADLAAASWCAGHNQPAGQGADTLPGGRRLFLPLATASGVVGVIGLDRGAGELRLSPDERRLLDALADQTAVSIERINLAEALEQSRLRAEAERLHAAVLTSLSHDLRTPLASILGAASSLERYDTQLDPAARGELLRTVQEEAERMERFVANLLDMTRLESAVIAPRREAIDLAEVVGSVLARARRVLAAHRVVLDLPADLPMLDIDPVLFEQVLFNLLDNAAKYAPAGTTVTLAATAGKSVTLRVADEGPGIPPDALETIFEKFTRLHATDRQAAGTGLGLAVCRGFIEAMGGRITAANRSPGRPEGGAVFTLTLPVAAA